MRTHFPGALREVRSAARFPLSVAGVWIPDEWRACKRGWRRLREWESQDGFVVRHSSFNNSKEGKHMEKQLTTAAGAPVPDNQEQNLSTETKCPFSGGARKHTMAGAPTNADWWPNQLNLKILHQHSPLSDPMGEEFNYAEEFKSLDLDAVIKDLACLDDDVAGLVARGLRPLWAALHPYGVA